VRWRLGGSSAGREPGDASASEPVVLCIATTEAEATMMRGLLSENDIEVAVAPSGGSDLRSLYGAGGRCVLLVLPENLDEARALIATHFS
jgi:hypothetical protein